MVEYRWLSCQNDLQELAADCAVVILSAQSQSVVPTSKCALQPTASGLVHATCPEDTSFDFKNHSTHAQAAVGSTSAEDDVVGER